MEAIDPEVKHQGRPGYNGAKEYGCRCDQGCGAANERIRARQRELRKQRLLVPADPSTFTHGLNGYRAHRCRCEVCCAAGKVFNKQNAAEQREIRARRKEAVIAEAMKKVAQPQAVELEMALVEPAAEMDWESLAYLRPGHGVRRRGTA